MKPFSPKELVLRVAAVLKRASGPVSAPVNASWVLEGHELTTDEDAHKASLDGEALKLTAAEWKILLYLSSNGGAVVTPGTDPGPLPGVLLRRL